MAHHEGSASSRVEVLRQKLEQYNEGIARAMTELASAAHHGGTTRLVPPSLSGVHPPPTSSNVFSRVDRDLDDEFLAAEASKSRSRGRAESERSQPVKVNPYLTAALETEVDDDSDDDDDDDDDEDNEFLPQAPSSDEDESELSTFQKMGGGSEFKEVDPRSSSQQQQQPRQSPSSSQPRGNQSLQSPPPAGPAYTFSDLETSYHRVNAIQECARAISSFPRTGFAPVHEDRAKLLLEARQQLLAKEHELREDQTKIQRQRLESIQPSEQDFHAMVDHLIVESEMAKKCFSAVYERKAVVYAKEKQLDNLGSEMAKLQHLTQSRRNTQASLEARIEQRRRALKRREEVFQQNVAEHAAREEELRKKVETVEQLNSKVSAWVKILETKEGELSAKEHRLKLVQSQLRQRQNDLRSR